MRAGPKGVIMQNRREKHRDIARSVLPSTMGVADKRRFIHKSERARVREFLHTEDVYDGWVPERIDGRTKRRVRYMVRDRRDADKLGPLLRWARHSASTDQNLIDATHEDRLKFFASILPNTLAGRHALTHIDSALRPYWNRARKGSESDFRADRIEEVSAALLVILGAGCHGELNRRICRGAGFIKGHHYSPPVARPRLLGGEHDIAAFAAQVVYSFQARIVLRFADELEHPRPPV